MDLSDAGLHEQPFRARGEPLAVYAYATHRQAVEFLLASYEHRHGLVVLQGPMLSGKSTVLRSFVKSLDGPASTAVLDGKDLSPETLLKSALDQFGYCVELKSSDELLGMLRVVAMQQTVAGHPPVLAIENSHRLEEPVLRLLCELADIKADRQSAIRLVLTCEPSVDAMINAPEFQGVAARVTGIHRLKPMQRVETRDYLNAKLSAAGAADPSAFFPEAVCRDIHAASGGWPGVVDRVALFAFARADSMPVTSDLIERRPLPKELRDGADALALVGGSPVNAQAGPRLLLSKDRELLCDMALDRPRLLIGRSVHNDLTINSRHVSRHHALLVSEGRSTELMDLNSTNGTYVNSRRVTSHVMHHDDVISFGRYRLKFVHPAAASTESRDEAGMADTVIMSTLEDLRHLLAGETLPVMARDPGHMRAARERD